MLDTNSKKRSELLRDHPWKVLGSVVWAILFGVLVAAVLFMATPARAANLVTRSGPSDALCIAAHTDRSPTGPHREIQSVKADCREHFWIVRPRIVVGPWGHVRFRTMPLCINEDGSFLKPGFDHWVGPRSVGFQRHCYWNAHTEGNGRGDSFILDHLGRHGHRVHITFTDPE